MLIYSSKLRFLACFCLVLPASPTFFNSLLSCRDNETGQLMPSWPVFLFSRLLKDHLHPCARPPNKGWR